MTGPAPMCMKCKHFHTRNFASFTCDAFPKGIPIEIIDGEKLHTSPIAGDHGIVFEPEEKNN